MRSLLRTPLPASIPPSISSHAQQSHCRGVLMPTNGYPRTQCQCSCRNILALLQTEVFAVAAPQSIVDRFREMAVSVIPILLFFFFPCYCGDHVLREFLPNAPGFAGNTALAAENGLISGRAAAPRCQRSSWRRWVWHCASLCLSVRLAAAHTATTAGGHAAPLPCFLGLPCGMRGAPAAEPGSSP
jgi:hypothetical protein